jgi:M3 family oligoendopeptidase
MLDFKDMVYERLDVPGLKRDFRRGIRAFRQARTPEAAVQAQLALQREADKATTTYTLAYIRNTMDTADPFYEAEMAYYNKTLPQIMLVQKKFLKALTRSPRRSLLEERFGSQLFRLAEAEQRTMNVWVIPQMIREANLSSQYKKLVASCKADFHGEVCNFYGLLKQMENPDRSIRREAFVVWAGLYKQIESRLDKLYDKLIATRTTRAKRLGFASFTELAYLERHRFDYSMNDVAIFRQQVREVIVPVCDRLRRQQAARIGVDKLKYYDEAFLFAEGNPEPAAGQEEMVQIARDMYRELSLETGEFFDFLAQHGLYDLETRPGKHLGGYCTTLPDLKAPFIFSNFNGSSADVDVLTHEAGHAFAYYTAARRQELSEYCGSTSEINEIHSMAMEHFTYPWMDRFFGEAADRYRYGHLCNALFMIPYIACVDDFQHRVYARPDMTADDRRAVWKELEGIYLPWRDYDGVDNMAAGAFWLQKQHIFLYPFYYIDYALAQTCVFELYGKMKSDRTSAWSDYLNLCQTGGSLGYFELLALAGLSNPFKPGNIEQAVANVIAEIEQSPWSHMLPENGPPTSEKT